MEKSFPAYFEAEGNPIITNIKNRNNINVYNYGASKTCLTTNVRGYEFAGATDGVPSMFPMSFTEIEYANSKNPELFVTGTLTFNENERDEIYNALGHPNWKEKFWSEEDIENALLYPTIAKMNRILAVQDIQTIERIRGSLINLNYNGIRKPIENVSVLVNARFREILIGKKRTEIVAKLPAKEEDKEKEQLKADKAALEERLLNQQEEFQKQIKQLQDQMKQIVSAQAKPVEEKKPTASVEKKPAGRPKKTT